MKKRFFLTVLCALSFGGAFAADWYADLASYDAGKSQEWFHALRGQSTDKAKAAEIEKSILEVLSGRKVSDEAFRYSCIILKPIATADSAKALSKFLGDENRVVPACDVLQTLGGDSGKEVLLEALKASKNPKCAAAILNALASAEGCEETLRTQSRIAMRWTDAGMPCARRISRESGCLRFMLAVFMSGALLKISARDNRLRPPRAPFGIRHRRTPPFREERRCASTDSP